MRTSGPLILLVATVLTGCGATADVAALSAGADAGSTSSSSTSPRPSATASPTRTVDPTQAASPARTSPAPAGPTATSSSQRPATSRAASPPAPAPVTATSPPATHTPVPPTAPFGYTRSTPPDGLVLTLKLSDDRIRRGETITATWTMHNSTDEPIRLSTCECRPVIGLYRDGEYQGGPRPEASNAVPNDDTVVAPGQTVTETIALDDGAPSQDRPVPPGTYDAAAFIVVDYNQALFTPAVTVTVE